MIKELVIISIIIQVVLILTGLKSALCCEKQTELYRDRQYERLHFLLRLEVARYTAIIRQLSYCLFMYIYRLW